MKRALCFAVVGLSIALACAFQVPTPQKKGKFKAFSEAEARKALDVEAKAPKAIVWKPICTLGASRLTEGGNYLLISNALAVSTYETRLFGKSANPNSTTPQGSISVFFHVPRAGKTVGLAFDLGILSPDPATAEFEFGAFDNWTKKTATIPGTVVKTFTPQGTGLHVMVIKMSSNGSFLFNNVRVYQAE